MLDSTNTNKRSFRHYLFIFCLLGVLAFLFTELRSSSNVIFCNPHNYQLSFTKKSTNEKENNRSTKGNLCRNSPTKSYARTDSSPITSNTSTPNIDPCFNKTKGKTCREEIDVPQNYPNATKRNEVLTRHFLRQQKLREFCRRNRDLAIIKKPSKNLFYSDKEGVVYCSVPKVACTNWKRVLKVFDGKIKYPLQIKKKAKVHQMHYTTLDTLSAKEREWRLKLYYSFIFVRHPFERLLSAYRNKFQDPYSPGFQRRYGSKILKLFREDLTKQEYKEGKNVTFEEFVKFIIHVHKNKGSEHFDEHWQIMHSLCKPCGIKYNYIGKMETLVDDADQVLREIGADKRVKFPADAKDKYKKDVRTIMKKYYAPIEKDILMQLYNIYEVDFLGFGYEFPQYLLPKGALIGNFGNSTTSTSHKNLTKF